MQTPAEVSRQFLQNPYTQANARGDFSGWHRGRPYYWIWALDVDNFAVRERVGRAADRLEGLLLDDYRRAPHITLGICGFPAAQASGGDSFTPSHLAGQIAAIDQWAPSALTLHLCGAGSFQSAPFLYVADPHGQLETLRAGLVGPSEALRRPDFVPHVTLGLYAGAWPSAEVARRLGSGEVEPLPLEVRHVSLMRYAAADIGGPLETLADYSLERRRFCWRHGAAPDAFAAIGTGTINANIID
jgi:2'-5' RNA ligase